MSMRSPFTDTPPAKPPIDRGGLAYLNADPQTRYKTDGGDAFRVYVLVIAPSLHLADPPRLYAVDAIGQWHLCQVGHGRLV